MNAKAIIPFILFLMIMLAACTQAETPTPVSQPTHTITPPDQATPTDTPIPVPYGWISVWEGHNWIQGFGWPSNKEVLIVMASSEGELKEEFAFVTTTDGEILLTEFESDLEDGDQFTIEMDGHQLQITARLVNLYVDPENNVLMGIGEPNVRVTISLEYPPGTYVELETISDGDGYFEFDLSSIADWDIHRHYWITHFHHPNFATAIINESHQVRFISGSHGSTFVSTRLDIYDLATAQTGNMAMDIDSDGDLDLILNPFDWPAPQDALPVKAYRNDGTGNFTDDSGEIFNGTVPQTTNIRHWAVQDFNGDGMEDLFLAESGIDHPPHGGGQSLLFIQNDAGQLIDETQARLPLHPAFTHHISAGDIDNDGDVDIYMCNIWGSEYGPSFYINDGAGYFSEDYSRIPWTISRLNDVYLASILLDVDNDGDLDLFLGGAGPVPDAILLNDGNGYFTNAPVGSLPARLGGSESQVVAVSSADFNHDGWLDLVTSVNVDYQRDINMQLLYNNGDGTFWDETARINQDWESDRKPGCHMQYGSGWLVWLYIVDPNNDGWPDILVQGASCMLSLLFANDQGESFSVAENVNEIVSQVSGGPNNLWAIVPGDFDGDSDLDYVILFAGIEQLVALRE